MQRGKESKLELRLGFEEFEHLIAMYQEGALNGD